MILTFLLIKLTSYGKS